jgi:aminoglycoside phosphotransferase (APT) family kinase protein
MSDAFDPLLSEVTGAPVTVIRKHPLAGGASMETWSLDVMVGGVPEALVMRRDMGANMHAEALTRAQEFALLGVAHAHGVRCPRPRWLYEPEPGAESRAFFLMDRCPGESVGRRVVRLPELAGARKGLARENPVWEYAWRWLSRRVPAHAASEPWGLVHGDFRVGNLLVTPDGLSAAIDWEFSHLGDPHEDLAWTMVRDWRFENDALPVGGVGTLDDLLAGYAEGGGRAIDRHSLFWWELIGNLRWAVTCHSQAERHLSGRDRSVELASLGRKAAEVEWELIDRIARYEEENSP